jgi:hypothetical protein
MSPEMLGGMEPAAFADLPPDSFRVLGEIPTEAFTALPPEVFGFGFGLFEADEGPPQFIDDAGDASVAFAGNAETLILENQAARGGAEAALTAANTPEAILEAQGDLDRLNALDEVGAKMSEAADELVAAIAQAETFGAEMAVIGAQRDEAREDIAAAETALAAATTPAAQTAAQVVLDTAITVAEEISTTLAEAQSEAAVAAAGIIVAEARGDVATAEIDVLNAAIPIQLFDAEIALIDAEDALTAKEDALVSLENARTTTTAAL